MKKKRKILICITIVLVTVFIVGLSVIIINKFAPVTVIFKGEIKHSLRLRYFNDEHKVQLPMAEKLGVKPVADDAEFNNIISKLTKVESSRGYNNEAKRPYLVSDAANLIAKIGNDFADSLKVRGLSEHKIIVTSMFRTKEDVAKLKSPTKIKNSTHLRGTTFDITYKSYKRSRFSKQVDSQQVYAILVNVLVNLKKQDKCYIIQEIQSPCFHITVRK
jgi:hypothetical protein